MSDTSQTSSSSEGGSTETIPTSIQFQPDSEPSSSQTPSSQTPDLQQPDSQSAQSGRPPSYVKLAMRNMVRKRGTSLYHFALTTIGLLSILIGLAYLTR